MQTVLLTGANGFVSWYLIRQLLTQDYHIIATGKGPSRLPFESEKLVYESLDFTNENDIKEIFNKHKPQIVVHAGAISKPDECELNKEQAYNTNVQSTKFLIAAAAKCKSYFLFVSTDFVFDGNSLEYIEAEQNLKPVNYYGETKKLAEEAVQDYAFDWSIVRTILVYGKPMSGRQNMLTVVANALQKGEPLKIFSDQTRKPTYVEDLANAMAVLIEKKQTGIFHIAGVDVLTPYEMAVAVAVHLGYDPAIIESVTAETFKQPAKRPPTTGFDLMKAKRELFYNPISFAEGLKKTFAD
ncbi:MAG TPA: SDR family oxidoreductase [Chitinophagaceae bacterium]|nr:SDR family oxidoreductase [Chitinophagaceae bacterium]